MNIETTASFAVPWPELLGGGLIGLGAALLWAFNGRVMGISGIASAATWTERSDAQGDRTWRLSFLAALAFAGWFAARSLPTSGIAPSAGWIGLAISGALVGIGTRLGGGCTSGHGVCGVGRGSTRSIVATATFVAFGIFSATSVHALSGGTP